MTETTPAPEASDSSAPETTPEELETYNISYVLDGGGGSAGTHDVYKLADAPVVFHPNPKTVTYPGTGTNEKWAINNADLVIRSGNYGIATIKLPFTVGDAIVSTMTPKDELG